MTDSNPVKDSIWHSLHKNGFPDKSVKLPFRAIFHAGKQHQVPMQDTLDQLLQEGVVTAVEGDHLLFQTREKATLRIQKQQDTPSPAGMMGLIGSIPGGIEYLQQFGGKMLGGLKPDQLEEMQRKVQSMPMEEKQKWLGLYSTLLQMFRKP